MIVHVAVAVYEPTAVVLMLSCAEWLRSTLLIVIVGGCAMPHLFTTPLTGMWSVQCSGARSCGAMCLDVGVCIAL